MADRPFRKLRRSQLLARLSPHCMPDRPASPAELSEVVALVRPPGPIMAPPSPELGRVLGRIEGRADAVHTVVAWLLRALWRSPGPAQEPLLEALALALGHPAAAPVASYLARLRVPAEFEWTIRAYLASVRARWSLAAFERRLERALRANNGRLDDPPVGAYTIHGCASPTLSVLLLTGQLRARGLLV
jgi:hypothetical protein